MPTSRKITFLSGTTLDTADALTSASFANASIGGFFADTFANIGATPTPASVLNRPFFYAQKQTLNPTWGTIKSWPIDVSTVTKVYRKNYNPAVPQITYAGYDGTSTTATLSYNCETEYSLKTVLNSPWINKYYGNAGLTRTDRIITGCCTNCTTGCGSAVCYTPTAQFVQAINTPNPQGVNGAFGITQFVGAEITLNNQAGDLATSLAIVTATFTNLSNIVTFSGNITIAAGTYLRITGAPNPGSQPVSTDPVYLVDTGVTAGTSITLDTPWQNASGTRAVTATTATSEIQVVNLTGVTQAGIKYTSKFVSPTTGCCCFPPFPYDVEGTTFLVTDSLIPSFPCALTINYAQNLSYGNGSWRELLYCEMDAHGFTDIRQWFKECELNTNYVSYLNQATNYDVFFIEHKTKFSTETTEGYSSTDNLTVIALPTGSSEATALDGQLAAIFTGNPLVTYIVHTSAASSYNNG